jgi:hypothetical protein
MWDAGQEIPAPCIPHPLILGRDEFEFRSKIDMSVTRLGATRQYSDNWDNIFGGGKRRAAPAKAAAQAAGKSGKKSSKGGSQKSAKKKSGKKKSGKAKR